MVTDGFPDGLEVKNILLTRRHGFDSWVWKIPWRKKLQPTPVVLLGKFHGQRSLAGYKRVGLGTAKESNMISLLNNNRGIPSQSFRENNISKPQLYHHLNGDINGIYFIKLW